jgi:hypothetical protein
MRSLKSLNPCRGVVPDRRSKLVGKVGEKTADFGIAIRSCRMAIRQKSGGLSKLGSFGDLESVSSG